MLRRVILGVCVTVCLVTGASTPTIGQEGRWKLDGDGVCYFDATDEGATERLKMVADADPTLDADLAAWRAGDCDLPRLTLLGPAWARTHGAALTKRRPFYTELLAYLATRPHGATPDEVADAIGISPEVVVLHTSRGRSALNLMLPESA